MSWTTHIDRLAQIAINNLAGVGDAKVQISAFAAATKVKPPHGLRRFALKLVAKKHGEYGNHLNYHLSVISGNLSEKTASKVRKIYLKHGVRGVFKDFNEARRTADYIDEKGVQLAEWAAGEPKESWVYIVRGALAETFMTIVTSPADVLRLGEGSEKAAEAYVDKDLDSASKFAKVFGGISEDALRVIPFFSKVKPTSKTNLPDPEQPKIPPIVEQSSKGTNSPQVSNKAVAPENRGITIDHSAPSPPPRVAPPSTSPRRAQSVRRGITPKIIKSIVRKYGRFQFEKIRQIAEQLSPAAKGSLFEHWLNRYVFRRKNKVRVNKADNAHLESHSPIENDNFIEIDHYDEATGEIWDAKMYSPGNLPDIFQIRSYSSLVEAGSFVDDAGVLKRATDVNYVFSEELAAQQAKAYLEIEGVSLWFIDDVGNLKKLN